MFLIKIYNISLYISMVLLETIRPWNNYLIDVLTPRPHLAEQQIAVVHCSPTGTNVRSLVKVTHVHVYVRLIKTVGQFHRLLKLRQVARVTVKLSILPVLTYGPKHYKICYICDDFFWFSLEFPRWYATCLVSQKNIRKTSGDRTYLFLDNLSVYEVKCKKVVNEVVFATKPF